MGDKMKGNKKGVSPLIATVLLIAFSVALGAVVMNWGTSYVRDTSEASEANSDDKVMCSTAVDVEFTEVSGVKRVFYSNSSDTNITLKIGVRNTGNQDINGFYVSMIGNTDILTEKYAFEQGSILLKGYAKSFDEIFDSGVTNVADFLSNGKLVGIELVPYTMVNGREVTCAGKSIKLNAIDLDN
ncbi:MAG: hypothetical protein PHT94_03660 [Candidatus Nanoarchaeia archaeon]|nr:hypothetical protein [Candidatus Nanoarchaeia archaeon]